MPKLAACTIISKNYLCFARTLAQSFRRNHPAVDFFVLVTDRIDGCFDPGLEQFTLIRLDQLDNIPDRQELCFRYNVVELNTAVKPFYLDYLFRTYTISRLLYIDPDILILKPLDAVYRLLDDHDIVLVPHITRPMPVADYDAPHEITFLQHGVYNLGFLGLSSGDEAFRLINWWKERLARHCIADAMNGLYTDQKWVDLVPSLFEGVFILREPGYNVAYWNLHEKEFRTHDNEVTVNGQPFFFYHFSALTISNLDAISRSQTRFRLNEFPALQGLFARYRDLLMQNGYSDCFSWPYSFDFYDSGEKISEQDRLSYRLLGGRASEFGDPFAAGAGSFYQYRVLEKMRDGEEQRAEQAHEQACRQARQELEAIYQSGGWRGLQVYYRVRNRIFPPGRLRTKAAKHLVRALMSAVKGLRGRLT